MVVPQTAKSSRAFSHDRQCLARDVRLAAKFQRAGFRAALAPNP
jgi:hypothetical protein